LKIIEFFQKNVCPKKQRLAAQNRFDLAMNELNGIFVKDQQGWNE